ncbi:hypothetical protein CEXT_379591 [Caerostris extrusa]|uniref:Uncharacterized protein n=1 Tax=Caerostris extrusa TaxID=172846 RepID=A0AAV4VIH0_CAEEX|nr:hypothetical protein CEXT_379591 [Caerostris extrusa]
MRVLQVRNDQPHSALTSCIPVLISPKVTIYKSWWRALAKATVEKRSPSGCQLANWMLVYSRGTEGHFMQIISVDLPVMGLSTTESFQIEIGVPTNPHRQTR